MEFCYKGIPNKYIEYGGSTDPDVYPLHYVKPIIVGTHGNTVIYNEEHLQLYESVGTAVSPESLFEAQLKLRLGMVPSWLKKQHRRKYIVSEDTFLDALDPDAVRGGKKTLVLKYLGGSKYDRIPYLKVDIQDLRTFVKSAKINLYISSEQSSMTNISIYGIDNNSWSEDTITYNNQSKNSNQILLDTVNVQQIGWYSFDVTDFINENLKDRKVFSFKLIDEGLSDQYITINSRENMDYKPYLEILPFDYDYKIQDVEVELEKESIAVKANIIKASNGEYNPKYIIALYNSSGKIENVVVGDVEETISLGETQIIEENFNVMFNENIYFVKILVLDSLKTVRPLAKSVDINIRD